MSILRSLAVAGLVGLLAGTAAAADDPVVALVGDEEIRRTEVLEVIEQLRMRADMPPQALYRQALDRLIDSRLLAAEARRAGVEKDPTFKAQLAELERRLLQQTYLDRLMTEAVTEEKVAARYKERYRGGKGPREVHARHILVRDEATAETLIAELRGGKDFAALARQHSSDGSASRGGDLGFFGPGAMVPPFEKAAFGLAVGEFTREPVESQFGWHVIKVEAERTGEAPPLDAVRENLQQEMARDVILARLTELQNGAKIERRNIDGGPLD